MARERITDRDVRIQFNRLVSLLVHEGHAKAGEITLHQGDRAAWITNKFLVNKSNVWSDAIAGYTKREAYNALRLMIATFSVSDWSK